MALPPVIPVYPATIPMIAAFSKQISGFISRAQRQQVDGRCGPWVVSTRRSGKCCELIVLISYLVHTELMKRSSGIYSGNCPGLVERTSTRAISKSGEQRT